MLGAVCFVLSFLEVFYDGFMGFPKKTGDHVDLNAGNPKVTDKSPNRFHSKNSKALNMVDVLSAHTLLVYRKRTSLSLSVSLAKP